MQTPIEQPPSPNPEEQPARRLLPERNIVIAELAFCAAFVVAAVIALVISFLAVLWQTLKAARTHPAEELKKE